MTEEEKQNILNNSFNDTLPSTLEHTPEASRSSSPSVSMHLRHVDRNLLPLPEPVLQHRLAPLIVTNRTPSPSPSVTETFPSDPPSPLVPTNPPLSDSSPTPPPTQILPTYSSSSTPTQQPPLHLRPPKPNANGSSFPEQNRRRSIFLPHLNAPKPLGVVQGAQGIAPGQSQMGPSGPQPLPPQQHIGQQGPPPRPHLFGVIRMALLMTSMQLDTASSARRRRSAHSPSLTRSQTSSRASPILATTTSKRSPSPIISFHPTPLFAKNPKGVKNITRKVIKRLEGFGRLKMVDMDMSLSEVGEQLEEGGEDREVKKVLYALGKEAIMNGRATSTMNGNGMVIHNQPRNKNLTWRFHAKFYTLQ